ncbi:MAG: hypothetical protein OXC82_01830 [Rhodobacteraceae bacterium]|nr:hypothetical protein [Paracoccaceae bacterium]MCY4249168.1 hypothetical protein [Paracoccaceae bacterium]MCY4307634.1 hypothetical protein [Paracoccaceae bacterium]
MTTKVPKFDGQESESGNAEGFPLEVDEKDRKNRQRSAGQRYWLRYFAIIIACGVMGVMLILLHEVVCWMLYETNFEKPSVYIVAYLAPISSLTILAIAMLVSAFRGYHKNDQKSLLDTIKELVNKAGQAD